MLASPGSPESAKKGVSSLEGVHNVCHSIGRRNYYVVIS